MARRGCAAITAATAGRARISSSKAFNLGRSSRIAVFIKIPAAKHIKIEIGSGKGLPAYVRVKAGLKMIENNPMFVTCLLPDRLSRRLIAIIAGMVLAMIGRINRRRQKRQVLMISDHFAACLEAVPDRQTGL